MRIALVLLLLVLAVAATAVIVRTDDRAAATDTGALTLVGDSLNVGTDPYLRDELPGWEIDAHDGVGRTTAEGIAVLREQRRALRPVVVVSLGTNDAYGSEAEFRSLVEEAVGLVGPDRCLVWATIVRSGEDRAGFNGVLRDVEAVNDNVRLVDWAGLVADDADLLEGDLVHGTPAGYARRAAETARVVRTCPERSGA
jgi:lysophospholipase L1-like esterase